MDPRTTTAIILALCILLIVATFVLGVEVGRASNLQYHPGYAATA